MILAVASGKGGTGKTTVAVSLALAVSSHVLMQSGAGVVFLDCDVEKANAAPFVCPAIECRREVVLQVPEVDLASCASSRRRSEICHYNAIAVVEPRMLVFPELCLGRGSCALNRPVVSLGQALRAAIPCPAPRWAGGLGDPGDDGEAAYSLAGARDRSAPCPR